MGKTRQSLNHFLFYYPLRKVSFLKLRNIHHTKLVLKAFICKSTDGTSLIQTSIGVILLITILLVLLRLSVENGCVKVSNLFFKKEIISLYVIFSKKTSSFSIIDAV